ncbi:ABC transporter permease [Devosia sp. A8/3-2]|nr:ABC transporter permease [Devosia sp. A8/3-2]
MLTFLRRYGTLIGCAAILIFFWISLPDTFMTARNWLNISQQLSMLIVVAAGMTIVMVMGDFDLSVGSMASLAGIVVAILFTLGIPVWAAVSPALLVGLVGGAINGALISFIGILPFVATPGHPHHVLRRRLRRQWRQDHFGPRHPRGFLPICPWWHTFRRLGRRRRQHPQPHPFGPRNCRAGLGIARGKPRSAAASMPLAAIAKRHI